jgi:hypothetical protein
MTPDSLDRVIELINLLHEEVSIFDKGIDYGCTKVGISFNDKNASVTVCGLKEMFNLFTRILEHSPQILRLQSMSRRLQASGP